MQLRERDKPAQEKPEETKKPMQASATEEPAGKKSKVTFNEADFMQPLNIELPSLTQEVTTDIDDARHHMHKAEVMSGVRRGATANGEETLRQICDLLKIPKILEDAYYEWLMHSKRPGPVFDREMIPRRGSRVKLCVRLPRPDGSLWRSIRDAHLKGGEFSEKVTGYAAEICTLDPSEAAVDAMLEEEFECEVAQAVHKAWAELEANMASMQIHAMAVKTRSAKKSKGQLGEHGIEPPPKGVGGVNKHRDNALWMASIAAEISSLTEMGTVSHLHTAADLLETFGVNIKIVVPTYTHLVYHNKISSDARGLPQLDKRKARMVVDGNPMSMQKGVHYDESFSATPKIETCRLMVVLRVLLRLASRCFDVSNTHAWAGRGKMIALRYHRGMEQYRDGEEVYMCLQNKTTGHLTVASCGRRRGQRCSLNIFETAVDNHKVPNGPMPILPHLYHRDSCGPKRRFTQR